MARLVSLIALLCAVAAVSANPVNQDLVEPHAKRDQSAIFGNCHPNDRLLYTEKVDVKGATLQIKKKDVSYTSTTATITCIKILDQIRTGKNAEFKINSGGINQRFVVINLKSERGGPINYNVQIYGL